jgi:predicted flap endonuclease-1-like 5' DNA nuclease
MISRTASQPSRPAGGRTAPPKPGPPLTDIPGIGKAREEQLKRSGIHSVRELAAARPEIVAGALTGVSLENAPHFITAARNLLESENYART